MRHLAPLFVFPLVLFLAPSAARSADAPGHYDKSRIMSSSKVFYELSAAQIEAFSPIESKLKLMDGALGELDLSLALTSEAVGSGHHDLWTARLDERATTFGALFEEVQGRFDRDGQAFATIFEAALGRAKAELSSELGGEPVECSGSGNDPFELKGPGGGSTSCPGDDLSLRIAEAWDSDAELAAALQGLGGEAWPQPVSYTEPQSAEALLSGGATEAALDGWIDPARLAEDLPEGSEIIDEVASRSEAARRTLIRESQAVDREAEDAKDRLASISQRAVKVRTFGEAEKAKLGAALWQALDRATKKKALRKKKIGVCLNPEDWGGCTGEDLTSAVRDALLEDRKLQKTLVKHLESMGEPNIAAP